MRSRVSRKSRRKYRLFSVIAVLTVIAGLSGFYLGWRLFTAITTRNPAVVQAPAKGSDNSQKSGAGGGTSTGGASVSTAAPGAITFSPPALTLYSFQAAALDKDRSAQAEASRLQGKGHPAYVICLPSSPPTYKVRVGAWSDKSVGTTYGASLKQAGLGGFMTSLSIAATPKTWRGSDAVYLDRVKSALTEIGGLVTAEAGWFDAYQLKKIDRPGLKTKSDPWRNKIDQAAQELGQAAAPADLTSLGGRASDAAKLAKASLEAISAFVTSGTTGDYNHSVSAYMAAVEGFLAALAWDGNK
ncbi:MAG TPA: SPOR domain-containing protein [Bacillota bacterium]